MKKKECDTREKETKCRKQKNVIYDRGMAEAFF